MKIYSGLGNIDTGNTSDLCGQETKPFMEINLLIMFSQCPIWADAQILAIAMEEFKSTRRAFMDCIAFFF